MTVDFESKTICTFSQIELSQMSQARMQSKQGAEWLIIKRWPDYRRYQTGHLLHSACITDTSLHVSLIPHYMYYWYLITCITDTSLHVSLIPHYMHHWYFITCITDTSLHVSLIPHYMYHWYLITDYRLYNSCSYHNTINLKNWKTKLFSRYHDDPRISSSHVGS